MPGAHPSIKSTEGQGRHWLKEVFERIQKKEVRAYLKVHPLGKLDWSQPSCWDPKSHLVHAHIMSQALSDTMPQ